MAHIITSRTLAIARRRPSWPFCLNKDSPQARGLVAWYPLGYQNDAYDLNLGKRIRLANTNSVPFVSDAKMGRVADFTPGSSHHFTASGVHLDCSTPVSLVVWVLPESGNNAGYWLSMSGSGWPNQQDNIQLVNGYAQRPILMVNSETNPDVSTGCTGTWPSEWTLYVGVTNCYDDHSIYAWTESGDYQLVSSSSAVGAALDITSTGATRIGAWASSTAGQFAEGQMADGRIYNIPLVYANVADLYDPKTRWDLYYELGRRRYIVLGAGGAEPPAGNVPEKMNSFRQRRAV